MSDHEGKPKPTPITSSFPQPLFDQKKRNLGNISNDADGVLMRLFRNIGYDLTNNQYYSNVAWKRMMDRYLDDLIKLDPTINRQNERGNFTKALQASKMSIKSLFKGFKLYRFKKVRFIVVATHEDDTVTVHSTTAALRPMGPGESDVEVSVDVIEEAVREAIRNRDNKKDES